MAIGIYRKPKGAGVKAERVADFSYHPNDSLAQMIVDAWADGTYKTLLLNRKNARSLLAARGFHLQNPVVIEEKDYNDGYYMKDDNEVVFVLPQAPGSCPPGGSLLDTARLLMACTPNGI